MKNLSRSALATLIMTVSIGMLTSSAAFTSETIPSVSRAAEIERTAERIDGDLSKQKQRERQSMEKLAEIRSELAPVAGPIQLGFDKMKRGLRIWGQEQKIRRAAANVSKGKSSVDQEMNIDQQAKHRIAEIRDEGKQAPEPTGLKNEWTKISQATRLGFQSNRERDALAKEATLRTERELIAGYKTGQLLDRDLLLARRKLVADMITVQRSVKLDNLKHIRKLSTDREQANLDRMIIEQDLLTEILRKQHDLREAKRSEESPSDTPLLRIKRSLQKGESRKHELIIAAQQLDKELQDSSPGAAPPLSKSTAVLVE